MASSLASARPRCSSTWCNEISHTPKERILFGEIYARLFPRHQTPDWRSLNCLIETRPREPLCSTELDPGTQTGQPAGVLIPMQSFVNRPVGRRVACLLGCYTASRLLGADHHIPILLLIEALSFQRLSRDRQWLQSMRLESAQCRDVLKPPPIIHS